MSVTIAGEVTDTAVLFAGRVAGVSSAVSDSVVAGPESVRGPVSVRAPVSVGDPASVGEPRSVGFVLPVSTTTPLSVSVLTFPASERQPTKPASPSAESMRMFFLEFTSPLLRWVLRPVLD